MKKIILASNNNNKVSELNALLSSLDINIIPQAEYNIPEAEETGLTFVENAILKARNACQHSDLPAIADDSGIVIDALNGAPGIYSARYAGAEKDYTANNHKVLQELTNISAADRTARFICVLALMRHAEDPTPIICQGIWEGTITNEPQGSHGFGYDPIFYVPTHNCTAAELTPDIKNQISHRGKALQQLLDTLP